MVVDDEELKLTILRKERENGHCQPRPGAGTEKVADSGINSGEPVGDIT